MFADIIVDISHEKLDRVFAYRIPDALIDDVKVGSMVDIPFGNGNRVTTGYIVDIKDKVEFDESRIKDIIGITKRTMPIESTLINIAWFIRNTYGSTMNQALKTVIPVKYQVNQKLDRTLVLIIDKIKADGYRELFLKKRAIAKLRLLDKLLEKGEIDYNKAIKELKISQEVIKYFTLEKIIEIKSNVAYRNPINFEKVYKKPVTLNEVQQSVAKRIKIAFDDENQRNRIHLIHGVTGSGKTEVYLDIIEEVIRRGKQAIILIPEIALTYQTVLRFYNRFGDRVSIINSKMSAGERYDQFERAKNGDVDIMIGPRSAIFTPFNNLGLIVIDEEHEATYKSEQVPKYHARETAIYRASLSNATVVMGSATPSVESYYKAQNGEYQLHEMNIRAGNSRMADVHIIDLREELEKGNRGIFSDKLNELILDRLQKKEQIMLFINRRGYGGFVSCRKCGEAMKCPHCDVGLTYHKAVDSLKCHYCGYEVIKPKNCPKCGSKHIAAFGTGTQKVEDLVKKQYPMAKVIRMDMDTTSKKNAHQNILEAFSNKEADILVGTQMIVKGHDFPNVTLVGIIAADLSLYGSDYRASERTFQLLTQACGRAGRGERKGDAVIQTYNPENYAVVAAANQNYNEFYCQEIMYRQLMDYPPVGYIMAILMMNENYDELTEGSVILKNLLKNHKKDINNCYDDMKIIGPTDASVSRISDVYRKVIYVKSSNGNDIINIKNQLEQLIKKEDKLKNTTIQFDFNPMNSY